MPSPRRIKTKKHYHILIIIFLVLTAIFFLYREFGKEIFQPKIPGKTQPAEKHKVLPRVVIVIDDLGPNKQAAASVFDINTPLTLSVMPHQTHTGWITEEGHRRGYDIIGHIPMEAKEPHTLGSGGLYTWMTEDEIRETLEGDFISIHYARGISNHMGSAFTEDARAVRILLSVLKEHGFFFLDSLTTSKSAGVRLAKEQGVKALKRDVFLDYNDTPGEIEAEWKKLTAIAQKNGYAIALAHPRKNTIDFLKRTLPSNKVTVVPISELAGD